MHNFLALQLLSPAWEMNGRDDDVDAPDKKNVPRRLVVGGDLAAHNHRPPSSFLPPCADITYR